MQTVFVNTRSNIEESEYDVAQFSEEEGGMPLLIRVTDPRLPGGIITRVLFRYLQYFETGITWDHVQSALREHFFSIELLKDQPQLGIQFLATYSTSQNYCTHVTKQIEWVKTLRNPNSEYSTRVIG